MINTKVMAMAKVKVRTNMTSTIMRWIAMVNDRRGAQTLVLASKFNQTFF